MKILKTLSVLFFGLLPFVLAGCFNPVAAASLKQEDQAAGAFTVDIMIGKDAGISRSVAGPDEARIKGDIRNFIQLIVLNESGGIVRYDEERRTDDSQTEANLNIDSIAFGQKYYFLLLMGHWERNYQAETGSGYVYIDNRPPTLMAAGFKEQTVTGDGKISISMWPVIVDTAFVSFNTAIAPSSRRLEPDVKNGKPKVLSLLPINWEIIWTIKGGSNGNGLSELLKAQNAINSTAGNLQFRSAKTMLIDKAGAASWENITMRTNEVRKSIYAYTSGLKNIGNTGAVNFKLEYAPFNLASQGAWSMAGNSVFGLNQGNIPIWIIRNGVNDLAQDSSTDFAAFNNAGNAGMRKANGNGAVQFVVTADAADPQNPKQGDLIVKDGAFKGPSNSSTPDITFITEGYSGDASVFYAVVPAGTYPPAYSDYLLLNTAAPGNQRETITVPSAGGDYDIYVIIFKDGKISAPEIINTGEGEITIGWEWG
ncbi:MAG: hypothetical protein LBU18_06470 [Treponema sp.]|jgi:hypothetical protein|nr:hypothetical protein [Treponema sp.]